MKRIRFLLLFLLAFMVGCQDTTELSTKSEYYVNLYLEEDDLYESYTVSYGEVVRLPEYIPEEDYIYAGWQNREGDDENLAGEISVTSDLDLYLSLEAMEDVFDFGLNRFIDSDVYDISTLESYAIYDYFGEAKHLRIPETYNGLPITSIFSYAFDDQDIEVVYIPNTVASVGRYAFYDMHELQKVEFYGDIEGTKNSNIVKDEYLEIMEEYHDECIVEQVLDDGTIIYREGCPFVEEYGKVGEIYLGDEYYYLVEVLVDISFFPEEYNQVIYENAFINCENLNTVIMPSYNLFFVGAFNNTPKLETVDVTNSIKYISVDGVIYDKDLEFLYYYPSGKTDTSYTVPEGTRGLINYAFYTNAYIEEIHLPSTLSNCAGSMINTSSLTTITVSDDNENYYTESGILYGDFGGDTHSLVKYPDNKPETSYIVPETITMIAEAAFSYNENLEEITLNQGLKIICWYAFAYTESLSTIDVPETVETIELQILEGSSVEVLILRRSISDYTQITSVTYLYKDTIDYDIEIYVPDDSFAEYFYLPAFSIYFSNNLVFRLSEYVD